MKNWQDMRREAVANGVIPEFVTARDAGDPDDPESYEFWLDNDPPDWACKTCFGRCFHSHRGEVVIELTVCPDCAGTGVADLSTQTLFMEATHADHK